MAVVFLCVVVLFSVSVGRGQTVLEYQKQRSFHVGASRESSGGPLTSRKPHLVDRFKEPTTIRLNEDINSTTNQIIESTKPPKVQKPSRPSFAGQTGGGPSPQIIPPGEPWPSRPEDYEEFSATSSEPQIVDRFKETTTIRQEGDGNSKLNQSIGSSKPPKLPKPSRPSFAGQTEGGTPPQIIPPGEPWPSRPEDYGEISATSSKPQIVDIFKETTTIRQEEDVDSILNQIIGSSKPPKVPKPSRPSFAGQTGGGTPPQIIPQGEPWPSRPEDYGEFSATSSKPQIVDRFKETTTIRQEGDGDSILNQSKPPKLPKPSRPSFAGQTGGGTIPQIIPPGEPWPSKPEDSGEFSVTSLKPQSIECSEEIPSVRPHGDDDLMPNQIIGSSRPPKLPKPSRPSFAGQTGGGTPPQIIPPGEPWPSRPENYGEFSVTSLKPQLIGSSEEIPTVGPLGVGESMPTQIIGSSRPPNWPKPSRPSFAGQTGGGTPPQIIPSGEPWPSRPENYGEFSVTSLKPQLIGSSEEIPTVRPQGVEESMTNHIMGSSRPPKLPKPSRPSFAGQTGGGTPPQIIPPGEPWPSRPENYEEFSVTSLKPQLIGSSEEIPTARPQGVGESMPTQIIGSSRPPNWTKPSRPSFAGQTGGGTPPQIIPPGEPWPSKPENYGEFSATSLKPQLIESSEEIPTVRPQGVGESMTNQIMGSSRPPKLPKPSRPSFAGQTGGGTPPQIIPPGEPWPSRPENYGEFSVTSLKPQLIGSSEEIPTVRPQGVGESMTNQIMGSSRPPKLPKPSRPSFAGQTGGGTPPQIIPPGEPWPSRPENYGEFSATSLKPQLIESSEEIPTVRPQGVGESMTNQIMGSSRPPKLPKPSRPSFAGQTGGGTPPQIIPPGEPWPSRPENYGESSVTSLKPQLIGSSEEMPTMRPQGTGDSMPTQIIGSSRPPKPSRPSFAGQTGGGTPPQIIPPGEPWPSSPENYEEFSATSSKPQIVERFEETTTISQEGNGDSILNQIVMSTRPPKLPKPSRPSFAGGTGGGTPPQIIPLGEPRPSRPEDYKEFSTTSSKPQIVDRFKETTTMKLEGDGDSILNQIMGSTTPLKMPKPSRPSFAGQSGVGTPSQIIPPGEPWPARPEDYLGFHFITHKPQVSDSIKETTTNRLQEGINSIPNRIMETGSTSKLPAPSRPSFAGLTGGGPPSQIIPPGKPWPARPEDYEGFSVTSRMPQLADRSKGTTKLQKVDISYTIPIPISPPGKVFSPVSTQSTKPWPTKQAEEIMTKIKDEVFISKKVSNPKPSRPEVNNLLLLDSPFFRQIIKSSNPWQANKKMDEGLTPDLLSFRPEDNPFTSAPLKRFIGV